MQPGGGTEQATDTSSPPKKGRQRAFVHPRPSAPSFAGPHAFFFFFFFLIHDTEFDVA